MKYEVNDFGTFSGKKIKYMLFGNPMDFDNSNVNKLINDENFELVKTFKKPFSTIYYLYNRKDDLYAVAYRHYARITNNKDDAIQMLSYATDITDLYHLV